MKALLLNALRLCALAAFALASPFAWAQYTAGAGLASTPHDFSGRQVGGAGPTSGLCTFCHTPHRGTTDNVLVWNRALSANTFSWAAGSATSGGTSYSSFAPAYTGTSVKCMSCHDGSVAVGDVSWFNAAGPVTFGGAPSVGAARIVGAGGNMDGNHPVAMPYPLNNTGDTYNSVSTGSGVIVTEFVADPTGSGIRLYNDAGGTVVAGANDGFTGIECASCHDPHNGNATTQDIYFLRGFIGGNTADYICVKCHAKN